MVDVEEMLPVIEKISKQVASDYPDVDWEDIRGGVCLFVIENKNSLKSKEEGGNPNWILRRVANQLCKEERVQHLQLSSQYSYRPSDVAKILETAWTTDAIDGTHVPEDATSQKPSSDPLDLASDVRAAYDTLSEDLKITIFMRYALGEIPDNRSYERKRLNKAIKELTLRLNRYRGNRLPTRRRAVSNASARAMISEGY